jgi:hypothetical protein
VVAKGKGRLANAQQDKGSAGGRNDYYSTRFARFGDDLAAEMRARYLERILANRAGQSRQICPSW